MKKTIAIIITGLTTLILLNAMGVEQMAFAENGKTPKTLKEETFSMQELFKLEGDDGIAEYFNNTEYSSPLIALIMRVMNFATAIFGTIAVIMIIIGGFIFMFSEGDETRVTAGKDIIKYAIMGIAATFLSYTIIIFVQSIFTTA